MTRLTVFTFELAELLQRFCSSWEIIISVCLWGFALVICRLVFGAFTYVLDALFLTVIRLAEGGQALATFGLVFLLPLGRRTHHPLIRGVLAHGFSPALVFSSRVGSSTPTDGWPLASLSCGLLTALCEPHAPCLFRLAGGLVTTNCSDRQVTALVTASESTRRDTSLEDMLLRSVL